MAIQETKVVNAFETTLDGAVAAGDSSIDLTDDPGVTSPCYLVIDPDNDSKREVVLWTSGAFGAAAVTRDVDAKHDPNPAHADGTTVRLAVVKQHIEDLNDRIDAVALTGDVTGTLAAGTSAVATTIAAGAVDFAMLNAADIITQSETITSNDSETKIPTAAAVKNYADAEAATLTNKILKDYAETEQAVTSAATLAINLANGNCGTVTLAHSVTDIDFTNVPTDFATFTLVVTQDGTGSRTMAINAITVNADSHQTAKTAGGGGLTLSTAASAVDIITFLFVDETPYLFNQLAFA